MRKILECEKTKCETSDLTKNAKLQLNLNKYGTGNRACQTLPVHTVSVDFNVELLNFDH